MPQVLENISEKSWPAKASLSPASLPLVVHLILHEGSSSVFDSQVLKRAMRLSSYVQQRIVVLTPPGQFTRRRVRQKLISIHKRAKQQNVSISWLPSPPTRLNQRWFNQIVLAWWLRRHAAGTSPVVLHCRNAFSTTLALTLRRRLANLRVIFDCRGAASAEYAGYHGLDETNFINWPQENRAAYTRIDECERLALRESDGVLFVSHAMRNYYNERIGLRENLRYAVVPGCVDTKQYRIASRQRDEVRHRLNLNGKFVVIYCGNLDWYQLPQESLRLFRIISTIKPNAHFLAITTHAARMEQEIRHAGILSDKTTVLSVLPDEVGIHLAAGDVALALRACSDASRVASPVKFGEYLASGLPVIATAGIGDYSRAILDNRLGAIVDLELDDYMLTALLRKYLEPHSLSSITNNCRAYAIEVLDWESNLDLLMSMYRGLTQ
jgi:glycosyltransferase involved in cell wall biosynthesis